MCWKRERVAEAVILRGVLEAERTAEASRRSSCVVCWKRERTAEAVIMRSVHVLYFFVLVIILVDRRALS